MGRVSTAIDSGRRASHDSSGDLLEKLLLNHSINDGRENKITQRPSLNRRNSLLQYVKNIILRPLSKEQQWEKARDIALTKLKKLDDSTAYKSLKARIHKVAKDPDHWDREIITVSLLKFDFAESIRSQKEVHHGNKYSILIDLEGTILQYDLLSSDGN